MTRVWTAVGMGAREYRRTPVLVALLAVLPAYVVGLFAVVAPDAVAVVHLTGGTARVATSEVLPASGTPMVAGLLAGVAGLFLLESAAGADGRLVVAGYRAHQVVLARVALLVGVSLLGSGVAVGVALTAFEPAHPWWFLAGTVLAALVYGAVGVLAGLLVDRLAGVYVVLFGSMVDLYLFQNPLATDRPAVAELLPGHFPLRLTMDAAFAPSVEPAHVGWGLAYLAALTALATLSFYRQVRVS